VHPRLRRKPLDKLQRRFGQDRIGQRRSHVVEQKVGPDFKALAMQGRDSVVPCCPDRDMADRAPDGLKDLLSLLHRLSRRRIFRQVASRWGEQVHERAKPRHVRSIIVDSRHWIPDEIARIVERGFLLGEEWRGDSHFPQVRLGGKRCRVRML